MSRHKYKTIQHISMKKYEIKTEQIDYKQLFHLLYKKITYGKVNYSEEENRLCNKSYGVDKQRKKGVSKRSR